MLDEELKAQLAGYLQRLVSPIELIASLDERSESKDLLALLHDIAALSPHISVRDDGGDERRPSFAVNLQGGESGVRFAGIPLGHEFTSLVLALLQVSGYAPKVSDDVLAQIRELPAGLHFETFISLSCHNCPDVVQALNLMSVVNPGISHTMVDGALFQDEVERKQIMSVPSVHLNGEAFGQGRFGGQVLDTMGIENFISVSRTEGPKLVAALEQHVSDYDVDVMNAQRATALSRGDMVEITLANGAVLKSKTVILATGARWREINVPGEQEYRGRGVAYCPHCDGPLFKGKKVAVIGGGNSGVEAAIDLAGIVVHVTLIEFDSELRADAVLQKKLRSMSNVTIITSALTTEVLGNGEKMTGLTYKSRIDDSAHELTIDGVFVQIGLLPNTDWLKGSVALSSRGEIEVDVKGQTSVPGVFAAGDVTTSPYKQIIIAMGEGSKAALSAFDHLIRSSVS